METCRVKKVDEIATLVIVSHMVVAPRDYHILGPLKEAMGGKHFLSDEETQHTLEE